MAQGAKSLPHKPGNPSLPSRTRARMLSSDLHMDGGKYPPHTKHTVISKNLEVSFEKLIIVPGKHLFTAFSEGSYSHISDAKTNSFQSSNKIYEKSPQRTYQSDKHFWDQAPQQFLIHHTTRTVLNTTKDSSQVRSHTLCPLQTVRDENKASLFRENYLFTASSK